MRNNNQSSLSWKHLTNYSFQWDSSWELLYTLVSVCMSQPMCYSYTQRTFLYMLSFYIYLKCIFDYLNTYSYTQLSLNSIRWPVSFTCHRRSRPWWAIWRRYHRSASQNIQASLAVSASGSTRMFLNCSFHFYKSAKVLLLLYLLRQKFPFIS